MATRLGKVFSYKNLSRVLLVEWVLVAAVLTLGAVTGLVAVHTAMVEAQFSYPAQRVR